MDRKASLIIALVIIAGAIFLFWRSGQSKNQFQTKIDQAITSLPVQSDRTIMVNLSGFAFKPDIIKIKKGTKVVWTNRDATKHTITSDDAQFMSSQALGKGDSYEVTFDRTGSFRYHCNPHPAMLGVIIVVD